MYWNKSFADAIKNAEHLTALGINRLYLDNVEDVPWEMVSQVDAGGTIRLGMPASVRFTAFHENGLSVYWSIDFEGRDASGKGVSVFDAPRLRDVTMKLPPEARLLFIDFLEKEVLPSLAARAAEIREALNHQADSEDCVRGLIAFARAS